MKTVARGGRCDIKYRDDGAHFSVYLFVHMNSSTNSFISGERNSNSGSPPYTWPITMWSGCDCGVFTLAKLKKCSNRDSKSDIAGGAAVSMGWGSDGVYWQLNTTSSVQAQGLLLHVVPLSLPSFYTVTNPSPKQKCPKNLLLKKEAEMSINKVTWFQYTTTQNPLFLSTWGKLFIIVIY